MKSRECLIKRVKQVSGATLLIVALVPGTSSAAHSVGLGTADSFAVLAGQTVTNTGPSVVNGDLGVSPGTAVVGFSPAPTDGKVTNGTIYPGTAEASNAQSDLTVAYNSAAGLPCNVVLTGQDLGGLTLTPGVYCFSTSAQLTGMVTLDAQGDPNAVFIFQVGSSLTTASNSIVSLIRSTQACNVFWQVGSSATLGTATQFRGNILALTSITANTDARVVDGRLLARNGAVTLDTNTISTPTCSHPVTQTPPPAGGTPTLSTTTGGSTTGGTTGGTGGTTGAGTRRGTGTDSSSGRDNSVETPDSNLPRTGDRYPTGPTLGLATFMILIGFLYNFLGSSPSPLALAVRGYQPKHRTRRWKRV